MSGFAFVHNALLALIILVLAVSIIFFLMHRSRRNSSAHGDGGFLEPWWGDVEQTAWARLAAVVCLRFTESVDRAKRVWFDNSDQGTVFGVTFIGLVLVLLPAASVINAFVGGSPFLALFYGSNAVALLVLAITAELKWFSLIGRLASLYLGVSLFAFIPAYVFHSFADRILHDVPAHAVMESILVSPLVFILAYGIMLGFEAILPSRRLPAIDGLVKAFLGMLPLSFVLTFIALHIGFSAVSSTDGMQTWPVLLSTMFFTSASAAFTHEILRWGEKTAASKLRIPVALVAALAGAALSSGGLLYYGAPSQFSSLQSILNLMAGMTADGARAYLGAAYWIMHLPFLPLAAYVIVIVIGIMAKGLVLPLQTIMGSPQGGRHYFLSTGYLFVFVATLLWLIRSTL